LGVTFPPHEVLPRTIAFTPKDEHLETVLKTHEVANVQEAVELASRFKDEGRYNWFRGQVQDWPPYSSYFRIRAKGDAAAIAHAERRIAMFTGWIKQKMPELHYLLEPQHVNDFFAIAQHYGIATNYIDFSTDPAAAGFFAADTANPPTEGRSCIYCLNTDDLMAIWDVMKDFDERRGMQLGLAEIDVSNLWRLQAQRGVFLIADYNWDVDYPMDKIVFPYSGYPPYPTKDIIYPEHKSPLEQRLDQYFSLERSTFTNEWLEQLVAKQNAGGSTHAGATHWESFPLGYYEEAFAKTPDVLGSWSDTVLNQWAVPGPIEAYFDTVGVTRKLSLNPSADANELRGSVSFAVTQILRSEPSIRTKAVDWTLEKAPPTLAQDAFNEALRILWNGMRRLPYSDSELAEACGSAAVLLAIGYGKAMNPAKDRHLFSQCFGECMRVGFANIDSSGSLACAALESLRKAARTDLFQLIAEEYRERTDGFPNVFRAIYNPRRMFEFEKFRSLFAREVIPAQAVEGRKPTLFNPVELITFGIP
jgi:hypothetical protein